MSTPNPATNYMESAEKQIRNEQKTKRIENEPNTQRIVLRTGQRLEIYYSKRGSRWNCSFIGPAKLCLVSFKKETRLEAHQ